MAREDERQIFGECGDYKAGFPYKHVTAQIAEKLKIKPEDVEKLIKEEIIKCQEIVEDDNFCLECAVIEDYLEEIEEE